ncbi:hypothetical protein QMC_3643, partial [Clostridioides difficile DA00245]
EEEKPTDNKKPGNDAFVAEVKIKKNGIESKKEEIMLKDNQKIILEYIEG